MTRLDLEFSWLKVDLAPEDRRLDLLTYWREVVQTYLLKHYYSRPHPTAGLHLYSHYLASTNVCTDHLNHYMSCLETWTCCGQYHKNIRKGSSRQHKFYIRYIVQSQKLHSSRDFYSQIWRRLMWKNLAATWNWNNLTWLGDPKSTKSTLWRRLSGLWLSTFSNEENKRRRTQIIQTSVTCTVSAAVKK